MLLRAASPTNPYQQNLNSQFKIKSMDILKQTPKFLPFSLLFAACWTKHVLRQASSLKVTLLTQFLPTINTDFFH